MKKIFAYQHKVNDYRRDTSDLSLEQHGIYRTLLDEYYITGGILPADIKRLARIVGVQTRSEKSSLFVVVERFFQERGDGYLAQKGADKELVRIFKTSSENSDKSKTRWNKNNGLQKSPALPKDMPDASQSITSNQHNKPEGLLFNTEQKPANPPPEGAKNAKAKRRKKPDLPLPDDWQPDSGHREKCQHLGYDIAALADEFRAYHLSRDTHRADWNQSFHTWIGNHAKFGRAGNNGRSSYHRPEPPSITDIALGVAARHSRENELRNRGKPGFSDQGIPGNPYGLPEE